MRVTRGREGVISVLGQIGRGPHQHFVLLVLREFPPAVLLSVLRLPRLLHRLAVLELLLPLPLPHRPALFVPLLHHPIQLGLVLHLLVGVETKLALVLRNMEHGVEGEPTGGLLCDGVHPTVDVCGRGKQRRRRLHVPSLLGHLPMPFFRPSSLAVCNLFPEEVGLLSGGPLLWEQLFGHSGTGIPPRPAAVRALDEVVVVFNPRPPQHEQIVAALTILLKLGLPLPLLGFLLLAQKLGLLFSELPRLPLELGLSAGVQNAADVPLCNSLHVGPNRAIRVANGSPGAWSTPHRLALSLSVNLSLLLLTVEGPGQHAGLALAVVRGHRATARSAPRRYVHQGAALYRRRGGHIAHAVPFCRVHTSSSMLAVLAKRLVADIVGPGILALLVADGSLLDCLSPQHLPKLEVWGRPVVESLPRRRRRPRAVENQTSVVKRDAFLVAGPTLLPAFAVFRDLAIQIILDPVTLCLGVWLKRDTHAVGNVRTVVSVNVKVVAAMDLDCAVGASGGRAASGSPSPRPDKRAVSALLFKVVHLLCETAAIAVCLRRLLRLCLEPHACVRPRAVAIRWLGWFGIFCFLLGQLGLSDLLFLVNLSDKLVMCHRHRLKNLWKVFEFLPRLVHSTTVHRLNSGRC
eukprot:m.70597 g.70597  ORF g.70597 m.70597 type:complete len:632 (+) comp10024_c0_seq1:2108-4003(+)